MNKDSYHILIYGIVKDENIQCISPFKEFKVSKNLTFIWFKFDRIDHIYQDYNHDTDVLSISNSSPSQAMKDLFNETYPNKEAKCYCLFRYGSSLNSQYARGSVVYGYWLDAEDDDVRDLLCDLRYEDMKDGMSLFSPDHGQSDNISHQFFYGKLLAKLPCAEDDNEEDHELLAENFMKVYTKQNIPSRQECLKSISSKCKSEDIVLSDQPLITIICDMCYCCT